MLLTSSLIKAEDNESYPIINSNIILSSEYLSSTYHRIDAIEIKYGFYEFHVESDIGSYKILSLPLFKKRINEIKTLSQAIDQYAQQNDGISDVLRSQLSVSGESAVDILTSPFKTARKLAGQLSSNLDATFDGEDPFVREEINRSMHLEPHDPTIARHKRNIAFQLGLDMYSSNYNVQSFLNTLASARASGKVSAGAGLSGNFTSRQNRNELDNKVSYIIKSKTLAELNEYNVDILLKLGINKKLIKAFIEHAVLSPTNKTVITTYLSGLDKVARLDSYIEVVLTADDDVKTLIYEQLSKMLLQYYNKIEKFSAFYNYKGRAAVLTESRRIVFFEYADLLIWSEENESQYTQEATHAMNSGYKGWEVLSLGRISPLASQKIRELGFKQHTDFLE
jgi:hypothetical protein